MQFSSDTNMKKHSTLLESVKDKYTDTSKKEIHHIQFFPSHHTSKHTLSHTYRNVNTREVFLEGGRVCVQRRVCKLTLTLCE